MVQTREQLLSLYSYPREITCVYNCLLNLSRFSQSSRCLLYTCIQVQSCELLAVTCPKYLLLTPIDHFLLNILDCSSKLLKPYWTFFLLQKTPFLLDPSLSLKAPYWCALRTQISLVVSLMIQILHTFLLMHLVLLVISEKW